MSELQVLDKTGDTRLQWNKKNSDEIAAAKKKFDEFKAKGYLSYSVDEAGKPAEVLHAFDPNEQRITLTPPLKGG